MDQSRPPLRDPVVIVLIGCLALVGSLVLVWAVSPEETTEPPAAVLGEVEVRADTLPSMMLVGDSITHGVVGSYTWRYFLYSDLAAAYGDGDYFVGPQQTPYGSSNNDYAEPSGWDMDHAALSGRTLDCYLDGTINGQPCDDPFQASTDLVNHNPDLVIVMLGTNDVALPWRISTPTQFVDQTEQLVGVARTVNPTVSMVLAAVLPVAEGTTPDLEAVNAGLEALAQRLDSPAARVAYIPVSASWDPAVHTVDGVHPNEAGDQVIADSVARTLSAEFGIGTARTDS
jgi:lysophospholipase L1-like esterase